MLYRVKVQRIVATTDANGYTHENATDIYEQAIEDLDVGAVIVAANRFGRPMYQIDPKTGQLTPLNSV